MLPDLQQCRFFIDAVFHASNLRNIFTRKKAWMHLRYLAAYSRDMIHTVRDPIWKLLRKKITVLKLRRRGSFRTSSYLSLLFRPVLESKYIKATLAGPMVAAAIVGSAQALPMNGANMATWEISEPLTQVLDYSEVIPTSTNDSQLILPVTSLLGISQNYHPGHPALDLRAEIGSEVVSMQSGTVSLVEYSAFGYGHRVEVMHEAGVTTLYAHLGEMNASVGEYVSAGESLGQVGMTGMTTGPHLHFEIRQDGATINPLPVIAPAIQAYQESLGQAD